MHKLDSARNKTENIIKAFSASFMNDSKWVKLLSMLSEINGSIDAKVKLVWDTEKRDTWIDDTIQYELDYYQNSMESMISGYPKGWYKYKEIEWIEFQSDIKVIENIINSIGKFELEEINGNLRLYGYK